MFFAAWVNSKLMSICGIRK